MELLFQKKWKDLVHSIQKRLWKIGKDNYHFNIEFMKDIDFITLVIIYKKKKISSSYFFHQILTYIGIPSSIHDVLVSLEKKDLIKSEGYFDDTSKLIKNISLTMAGEKVLQEDFTKEKRDNIKEYYNNDLLNKILS